MDRRLAFNELRIVQPLILELYGSLDQYLNSVQPELIEPYLIEYDVNAGDAKALFYLSTRLGAQIIKGSDPDLFMYSVFEEYLRCRNLVSKYPSCDQMIRMTHPEFVEWGKRNGVENPESTEIYLSRFLILLEKLAGR